MKCSSTSSGSRSRRPVRRKDFVEGVTAFAQKRPAKFKGLTSGAPLQSVHERRRACAAILSALAPRSEISRRIRVVTCARPKSCPIRNNEGVRRGSTRHGFAQSSGVPTCVGGLIALAGLACAASAATLAHAQAGHTQYGTWGVDLAAMDKSVKPGDDFFLYVNGNWLQDRGHPARTAPAPARSRTLRILSEKRMKEIAADARREALRSADARRKEASRSLRRVRRHEADRRARPRRRRSRISTIIARLKTPDDVARAMGRPDLGAR